MSKSAPTHRESIDPQAFYDEVARLNLSPLWLREGHPPHKRAVPWLWQWPVRARADDARGGSRQHRKCRAAGAWV